MSLEGGREGMEGRREGRGEREGGMDGWMPVIHTLIGMSTSRRT